MPNKITIKIRLKKMFLPYFSTQGTLCRSEFLVVMVSFYLLLKIFMEQSIIFYNIVYWPIFYLTLAAIQKRCRDINWNGTFFILLYSIAFPFLNYYQYMKRYNCSFGTCLLSIIYSFIISPRKNNIR